MGKDKRVVTYATAIAMAFSVLAVLIGSGIGWGVMVHKVSSLEARATIFHNDIHSNTSLKLDKESYYRDISLMHDNIKVIRSDVKSLLLLSKKPIH